MGDSQHSGIAISRMACKLAEVEQSLARIHREKDNATEELVRLNEEKRRAEDEANANKIAWRNKEAEFCEEISEAKSKIERCKHENGDLQRRLEARNAEVNRIIDGRSDAVKSLKAENYELKQKLDDRDRECTTVNSKMNSQVMLLDALEEELRKLRTAVDVVGTSIQNNEDAFSQFREKINVGFKHQEELLAKASTRQETIRRLNEELAALRDKEKRQDQRIVDLEANERSKRMQVSKLQRELAEKVEKLQQEEQARSGIMAALENSEILAEKLRRDVEERDSENERMQRRIEILESFIHYRDAKTGPENDQDRMDNETDLASEDKQSRALDQNMSHSENCVPENGSTVRRESETDEAVQPSPNDVSESACGGESHAMEDDAQGTELTEEPPQQEIAQETSERRQEGEDCPLQSEFMQPARDDNGGHSGIHENNLNGENDNEFRDLNENQGDERNAVDTPLQDAERRCSITTRSLGHLERNLGECNAGTTSGLIQPFKMCGMDNAQPVPVLCAKVAVVNKVSSACADEAREFQTDLDKGLLEPNNGAEGNEEDRTFQNDDRNEPLELYEPEQGSVLPNAQVNSMTPKRHESPPFPNDEGQREEDGNAIPNRTVCIRNHMDPTLGNAHPIRTTTGGRLCDVNDYHHGTSRLPQRPHSPGHSRNSQQECPVYGGGGQSDARQFGGSRLSIFDMGRKRARERSTRFNLKARVSKIPRGEGRTEHSFDAQQGHREGRSTRRLDGRGCVDGRRHYGKAETRPNVAPPPPHRRDSSDTIGSLFQSLAGE